MNITDACKEILDKYGKEQQLNIAVEECSELIKEVSKYNCDLPF